MWYIYTMEYYSAVRKKEILLFAITLMKLEGIMAKLNTSDREGKYCMISLICGI